MRRATGTQRRRDPGSSTEAHGWRRRSTGAPPRGDLNALEREFLDESRAAAEHEAEQQRATNRRLRALLAGLAGLLVLAVVAGVVALNQRGDARDAALSADAQRLGAEALTQERFDRRCCSPAPAWRSTRRPRLRATSCRSCCALRRRSASWTTAAPLFAAAVSPDGRLMAIGDDRGKVTSIGTRKPGAAGPAVLIRDGAIQHLRFSPDGHTLAVGAIDPTDQRRAR